MSADWFPGRPDLRACYFPAVKGPDLRQVLSLLLIRETHLKPNSGARTHPHTHLEAHERKPHTGEHSIAVITGAASSAGMAGPWRVPAQFPARLSLSTTAPHRASSAPRASAPGLQPRSSWQRHCSENTLEAAGKQQFSP